MPTAHLIADLILVVHALWVSFIVFSVPLIIFGKFLKWNWVSNSWFRHIHLAMMALVTLEALLALTCPLTDLENLLRYGADNSGYSQSFVSHWISRLIFFNFEPWIFTLSYVLFFLLIVFLYLWVPPHWWQKRRTH